MAASRQISATKLMFIVLTFSSGTSMALFVPALLLVQQAGMDLRVGVVPFAIAALVVQYLLFRALVNRVVQMSIALRLLEENSPVAELEASPADVLWPMVTTINALIRERTDLRTMRGHLVEQISAAAAQEERNRLARDLHDSIKQQVFSMSISAAAAHAHLETNPLAARAALLDVKQSAQEAMVEMRALLQQLSPAPLEKSGLIQALREQCEALAYRSGAVVDTQFGDLPADDRLPPGTQEALFRIAQEALSNIARHARARRVELELSSVEPEALILRIRDDGQGFDPDSAPAGMGLNNIRSRAASIGASCEVLSEPGAGTTLSIHVPFIEPEAQEEKMYAEYETQAKPVISLLMRAAVGAVAFLVSLSMLAWRVLQRGVDPQDTLLVLIFAGLIVALVASAPFAGWSWVQARQQMSTLLLRSGRSGPLYYRLRRHVHFASLVLSLGAAWFLPILAIALETSDWLRVVIGAFFLGLGLWNYKRMGDVYRVELALMLPARRIEELRLRAQEVRSGWFTTIFLVVIVFLTNVLGGDGFHLPPQDPDHWMDIAFITMALLLLANQVVMSIAYRRYLAEASTGTERV